MGKNGRIGLRLSESERELLVKYYGKGSVSVAIRYLIQKQLSEIVFDDEFLVMVSGLPEELRERLSKHRTAMAMFKKRYVEKHYKEAVIK